MPTNKSILITTFHTAYIGHAGGEFDSLQCAEVLRQLGYTVDFYGPYSQDISNYEVFFHFGIEQSGIFLLSDIKNRGKKVFLWPNIWFTDISNISSDIVNFHINCSNYLVFKSVAEKNNFTNYFDIPLDKIVIIKPGVDPIFSKKITGNFFKQLYQLDNYAISFGTIEPSKNQHQMINILKKLNIPLVLVGKNLNNDYYEFCKNLGGPDILFIDSLIYKSDLSRAALQESLLYIEISNHPAGTSALSAGLSGCKLALTDDAWSSEVFGKYAHGIDINESPNKIAMDLEAFILRGVDVPPEILNNFCTPDNFSNLISLL